MTQPTTYADRIEAWLAGKPAAELGEDEIRAEFRRLNSAVQMMLASCQGFGDKLEAAADELLENASGADGPVILGMQWGQAMALQRTYVLFAHTFNNLIVRARAR